MNLKEGQLRHSNLVSQKIPYWHSYPAKGNKLNNLLIILLNFGVHFYHTSIFNIFN